MTRYYNENPQVRHWMGKCATLQQELDMACSEIKILKQELTFAEYDLDLYRRETKEFDNLPWYKKMFYKFNI